MSKAIQGVALLGGAAILGAFTLGVGGVALEALGNSALGIHALEALVLGGLSMEAGAIAGALTANRGQNITTRQAAAFRQIIYGEQRVGGVQIYQSTTGSHHDQYNFVIVLAGHVVDSIVNLYLDGRQVFWQGGVGNTTRNGVNFGGTAAGGNHTGPNGQQYNFGNLVYCEAKFGDQALGDVIGGLTANDPHWAASASGSPFVGGCTYVYLKIEYDENQFPGLPEIRFTVRGKNNILDPRTGARGYTKNWALIVADVITDTQFGLGLDGTTWINQGQLIAAANVCDEQVTLAAGGTEARYETHFHYDTSLDPGSVLETMMTGAQGRLSFIGGEYYIWPAYWQGPAFSYDMHAVTSEEMQWTPQRSLRDRCNRVNGTYIAPNYPYNAAGDLYDGNGFYYGSIQNNFPFAFQPTNYPQYAADVLHGYATDQYLNEDLGILLPKELSLQTVLSVAQAQRLAKIYLMRNRQQGSGSWEMGLQAFPMQEMDVMQFTCSQLGWTDKVLEVQNVAFNLTPGSEGQAPAVRLQFTFAETAETVYEWNAGEELTVYDVPALPTQVPWMPAAPTNLTLTSGQATAVIGADGIVRPRIAAHWNAPYDRLTQTIQVQYAPTTPVSPWIDAVTVDVENTFAYISNVVAGAAYNVRIRGLRANGAYSDWVEIDGYVVATTLSTVGQDGVGIGSLVGQAFSGGTAGIYCGPFTARIGSVSVSVLPSGYTITGLVQGQLYEVYYVDPGFAGGAVTPIATQNPADYLGRNGYFKIDAVVTPTSSSGSGGSGGATGNRYYPAVFHDTGDITTTSPEAAFDGNTSSFATIFGSSNGSTGDIAEGTGLWQGFPNVSLPDAGVLTVKASVTGSPQDAVIAASFGGTTYTLLDGTTVSGITTYTQALPSATPLGPGFVQGDASASSGTGTRMVQLKIYEIYIDA